MAKFFDTFKTTSGLNFVGKEEKAVLIQDKVQLPVLRVFKAVSKFGPRYILVTEVDGEERALGFAAGMVDSRDNMLDAMIGFLDDEDAETPVVVLRQAGQAVIIEDAETVV